MNIVWKHKREDSWKRKNYKSDSQNVKNPHHTAADLLQSKALPVWRRNGVKQVFSPEHFVVLSHTIYEFTSFIVNMIFILFVISSRFMATNW